MHYSRFDTRLFTATGHCFWGETHLPIFSSWIFGTCGNVVRCGLSKHKILLDSSQNIYVTGTTGPSSSTDIMLKKYAPDGVEVVDVSDTLDHTDPAAVEAMDIMASSGVITPGQFGPTKRQSLSLM